MMSDGSVKAQTAEDRKMTAVEEMRDRIKSARRTLAYRIYDFFDAFDTLSEEEFVETMKELDNHNGIKISEIIEKFRKYRGL